MNRLGVRGPGRAGPGSADGSRNQNTTKQGKNGHRMARRRRTALPGIRWIPVPLALLAAAIGSLVFGSLLGQSQATIASQPGWLAGGLELSVQHMGWMSNDMTGQGPLKVPKGFPMDPGMMPGMQSVNDNRLRVEVNLQNITRHVQAYAKSDFRVLGPNGQSWPFVDVEGNGPVSGTTLQPGYVVTLDLYFDIPIAQSKGLSIAWTRGGVTVDFPVSTNGVPTPHHH
jgi:hypothetical protein